MYIELTKKGIQYSRLHRRKHLFKINKALYIKVKAIK